MALVSGAKQIGKRRKGDECDFGINLHVVGLVFQNSFFFITYIWGGTFAEPIRYKFSMKIYILF